MPAMYLTKDGFQKLQEELEYLRTAKRQEVAERLHEAMEGGELIENAEYEAAKNEQAFVEGRIQELEIILAAAHLIDESSAHQDPTLVQVGDTVVIEDEDGSTEEYTIVGAAEADPRAGKISNESPLGRTFLHKKTGDKVLVETPKGEIEYEIIKIS